MTERIKRIRAAGKSGEDYVSERLAKDGYRVLCRHYTVRGGEIDVIAEKGSVLAFVEVKQRAADDSVTPSAAVDEHKQSLVKRTAQAFLTEYRADGYLAALTVRFDTAEVFSASGRIVGMRYTENAFS